jgi:glycosyltransferase involved in cell wall biosynthesis
MKTSVLILCKNEAANLGPCLEGVFGQKGAGEFEVVVVDSGSTDGTVEVARRYPVRVEEIPKGTFHHARTRNHAAELARGEILVYLAADAFPATEEWLKELVKEFEDKNVGAAYGRHVPKAGSGFEREDALGTVYGEERMVKEPASRDRLGYRYYHMSTVNAAIRRDVWAATKFPEELKVFEDLGIAKRILDGGWKIVYEPRASVYHSHEHTTAGLFKRYFDIGYTLRKLGIWNEGTRGSLLRDGWRLVRGKIARFDGNGNSRRVGASLTQEMAKSAGMILGLNERFLPQRVKRRMSAFGVYE